MPGFDLDYSLLRVDGDGDLLFRLLRGFALGQADALAEIDALLAAGETRQAAARLHTIKGAAGNLGATSLAVAAANLEEEMHAGGELTMRLAFAEALQSAISAITHCVWPSKTGSSTIDPEALGQLLSTLKPILECHKLIPDELVAQLQQMAQSEETGSFLGRLLNKIDNFDFDGALMVTAEVASQYGLEPLQ